MSVADPELPAGGCRPRRGVLIPETVTFRIFCMSKRKNLDPRGGRGHAPGTR